MRHLILLLVAACSSGAPPQQERAPEPCPPEPVAPMAPVEPVAPPPAAAKPEPDLLALSERCPVGDLTHVTVYNFLEHELADAAKEDGGRRATREVLALEAELVKKPDMKPQRASVIEGEMSHVLDAMCRGTPGCKAVGLYNKSGLAIALSSVDGTIAPLGFDDARWATLKAIGEDGAKLALTAAEAENLAVDRHALVAFPAKHGLAACIVEK